jgi:F-type H+-transporting ATPase subunit gamma
MATAKEIKGKMGSVKSTQKITRAMELIAASKMRNARHRMETARPYAESARQIIRHVALSHPEYRHPYLGLKNHLSNESSSEKLDARKIGIILVSTDRGLCGGLNINLFREVSSALLRFKQQKVKVQVAVIGQKGQTFMRGCDLENDVEILAAKAQLGDKPKLPDVIGCVQVMLDAFDSGEIEELYLFSNAFVTTVKQSPYQLKLLPIEKAEDLKAALHVQQELHGKTEGIEPLSSESAYWDYLYEPEAKVVLNQLFKRYIESQVYQGVVENIACEQAARMVAMKNATDNAGKMLQELKLKYNKARQAAITQELAEIVSGADAQNN